MCKIVYYYRLRNIVPFGPLDHSPSLYSSSKTIDIFGRFFSAKGDKFCDFLFALLHANPIQKRVLLYKERIRSLWEDGRERGQNKIDRVVSLKSVSITLKKWELGARFLWTCSRNGINRWAVPSENMSSNMRKTHTFRFISRIHKVSSGQLLAIDTFKVSNDHVSGQRRPWSDCAVWSGPSLSAHTRRHVFTWRGSSEPNMTRLQYHILMQKKNL